MRDRQRVAIDIVVVRLDCHRRRSVFINRPEAVIHSDGWIIHSRDRAADRRGRRAAVAVADRVRKRGRAVVVGRWCEGQQRPCRVERHRTVRHRDGCATGDDGRPVHLRDRQRVAVDVAVVRLHRDADRRVFVRRETVVHGYRRIVHCRHRSGDRR